MQSFQDSSEENTSDNALREAVFRVSFMGSWVLTIPKHLFISSSSVTSTSKSNLEMNAP